MILVHLQLVIGLILYSISPKVLLKDIGSTMKDPLFRFFAVEHLIGMLIAIIIITIGRSKSKKINEDIKKHKIIFVYYLIGLVIIFMSIPWPFLKSFGSWF